MASNSNAATFAAIRLTIESWRWQDVPFYLRAGKRLPVTCTEVMVRLRRPPTIYRSEKIEPNHLRLRISPDMTIALGMMILAAGSNMGGSAVEMLVSHHPNAGEVNAYERLLGDALAGDATLFAREDYVEEAWRIVDPLLKTNTSLYMYEPGSWGPDEAQRLAPPGGWHNPKATDPGSRDVFDAA